MWKLLTHRRIQLLAQAHRWNDHQTDDDKPCDICGTELKEHNFRECIMNAWVRVDVCGHFKIKLSIPKEKLDRCPVEPQKHGHETIEELKQCYLGKKIMFEASRREEWQLLLKNLKLNEAIEPCPKCGCFWREQNQAKCRGVGTKEDNLWVTHGHYYPEVMEILKMIIEDSKSEVRKPCPLCSNEALHKWLECLRMAQYQPFMLLDCDVIMRLPMGPEEVTWLQQDPLLIVENGVDGKPIVKSRMPLHTSRVQRMLGHQRPTTNQCKVCMHRIR